MTRLSPRGGTRRGKRGSGGNLLCKAARTMGTQTLVCLVGVMDHGDEHIDTLSRVRWPICDRSCDEQHQHGKYRQGI